MASLLLREPVFSNACSPSTGRNAACVSLVLNAASRASCCSMLWQRMRRVPAVAALNATSTPAPVKPMFYRLNALIDRASDQGVLPHLLARAALQKLDDTSHVLPGADLRFPDGSRLEVDLVGVLRGKVVAGEV